MEEVNGGNFKDLHVDQMYFSGLPHTFLLYMVVLEYFLCRFLPEDEVCWLAVGFAERLSSPGPFLLNRQAFQDNQYLIWSQTTDREELTKSSGEV